MGCNDTSTHASVQRSSAGRIRSSQRATAQLDEEFLLPRSLTQNRSAIRVKVEFVPKDIPLYPGRPLDEQAWSEYRYWAYCYVMPKVL